MMKLAQKKQKKKRNNMKKTILDYDAFVNEAFAAPTASVLNTPGMGNVTAAGTKVVAAFYMSDSGDKDTRAKHLKMHERGHYDDSWMKPSGDYSNRNWLVPNYEIYQRQAQSNARFQIGQQVKCVNPMKESYGMVGKIIAFEDNTIRWEATNTRTGVGAGSPLQYRCHAADLEVVNVSASDC
jgi:hypothetical protein